METNRTRSIPRALELCARIITLRRARTTCLLIALLPSLVGLHAQAGTPVSLTLDRTTARAGDLIRLVSHVSAADGTMTFVDVTTGLVLGSQSVAADGSAIRLVLVDAQRWTSGEHQLEARYTGSAGAGTSARQSIAVQILQGAIAAWGYGEHGQIGNGTANVINPVPVPNILSDAVAVRVGLFHTIALKTDGTVWTWGDGARGALGLGPSVSTTTVPRQILVDAIGNPFSGIVAIAAGESHSLAVKYDGGHYTLWSWGFNGNGELGDNTFDMRFAPVQVRGIGGAPLSGFVSIAAGANHSLALGADGSVYAWGNGSFGQRGETVFTGENSSAARRIDAFAPGSVKRIAAGSYHSLALGYDGAVYGWGLNFDGELGVNDFDIRLTPTLANTVPVPAMEVAAGAYHSLAMYGDGTVHTWGFNFAGALGNSPSGSSQPDASSSRLLIASGEPLTGVVQIAAGSYHTLALKQDGTVWSSGYNAYGALGNGSPDNSEVAVDVSNQQPFAMLSDGSSAFHAAAIEDATTVMASGFGAYGSAVTLTASLKTLSGRPLPGVTVTFSIGGLVQGSATTNDLGDAVFVVNPFTAVDPEVLTDALAIQYQGPGTRPGSASGWLFIDKGTPATMWRPMPLDAGAPLGANQLNATASVPGAFVYESPAGTILPAGGQVLKATFMPDDSARWNSVPVVANVAVRNPHASTQFRGVDLGAIGQSAFITGLNNQGQIAGYDFGPTAARCWMHNGSELVVFGPQGRNCFTADINDAGFVLGYARSLNGDYHPFLYSDQQMIDVDTDAGVNGIALAINGSGLFVGYLSLPSGDIHAFVYENGVIRELDPQCPYSIATDINDAGQIAGFRSCSGGALEPFRYQNGAFERIVVPGAADGGRLFINAAGDVAGSFVTAAGGVHPFVFRNGAAHELGALAPGAAAATMDLGDGGVAVGTIPVGDTYRAFSSAADGSLVNLGALDPADPQSLATSVNASGQIVGWSFGMDRTRAFFSTGAGMQDLDALLTADSATSVVEASKINTAGQIAATAFVDGEVHIVLLTPAIVPSELALAASSSPYGTRAQLTATLTSNGAALAQKTITFSVDGVSIGNAETDSHGVATLAAAQNLAAGPHQIGASFGGDARYSASSGASTLAVTRVTPTIAVVGGTFPYDGLPHAAVLTATGVFGEALAAVTVTYNGSSTAPVAPGTYTVVASFAGGGNYNSATANAVIAIIAPIPANQAPIALCRNVTVVAGADSFGAASIDAGSKDPDGDAITVVQSPAGPFRLGQTRVTLSVTDSRGASRSCDATVTVLRYGLRAAYGFEEAAGSATALDTTPLGNNGTLRGPSRTTGRFGQGMRFDGIDDIIDVADSDSLDLTKSMTLMAWVRPDADRGWRTILLKERQGGLAYALYANNATGGGGNAAGYVRLGTVDREIEAHDDVLIGQWAHIAMSFGGGRIRIYVNGVLQRNESASGNAPITNRPLRLGGNTSYPDEFFSGVMDEVRVYDRVLSDLEIRDDMESPVVFGSQPPITSTSGLVAAYSFDDGTATDVSGHGHNGVLRGPVAAAGRQGKALSFDGIKDVVEIADQSELNFTSGMSVEAWVYPTSLGTTWRTAVLKTTAGGLAYGLYANDAGKLPAGYVNTSGIDHGAEPFAGTLPLNAWTHLVATYDKATARLSLWVNGVAVAQQTVTNDIVVARGSLFIGGNNVWGEYFAGLIDSVRIYNRALNVVEIQTNLMTPPSR